MKSPICLVIAVMLFGSASWLRAGEPDELPPIHVEDYRTPFMSPIRDGGRLPECEELPSEREIMRAIHESRRGDDASLDNVKIVCERVVDKIDPPRFCPLVGDCALHHCRWKCTVYFTETVNVDGPVSAKIKKHRVQVVHIDKDHVHLVALNAMLPETVANDDLAMIPTDTIAFASVRVRDLAEKLDLARWAWLFDACGQLEKNLGVTIAELDRVTIIATADSGKQSVAMIRGSRPYKRDELLKAADYKKVDLQGREAYVSKSAGVICFIDERTILAANSEEILAGFLTPRRGQVNKHLKRAAELAKTNDVAIWVDVAAVPKLVTHLPKSVESLHCAVNVQDNGIAVQLGVSCAGRDGAHWATKALQAGLKFARSASLMGMGVMDGSELFPTLADSEFRQQARLVPLKLLRQTEKGLEGAQIQENDDGALLSMVIPIDQKSLRGEITGIVGMVKMARSESYSSPFCLQRLQGGMTLPSGQYLEHAPLYFPPEPPTPSPAATETKKEEKAPKGPTPDPLIGPASFRTNDDASQTDKKKSEVPMPVVVQSGMNSTGRTSVKIAVANVRKEAAMLFTMTENGKLCFVQKLPAGEAVDLKTTIGVRWLAVFTDNPAGESFTPNQAENTWLLRP